MDMAQARKKWNELHDESVFAEQDARTVEARVRAGFLARGLGEGAGPSAAVIAQADALRKVADRCHAAETAFLREFFR